MSLHEYSHESGIQAGQVWSQKDFPCHTRYVVISPCKDKVFCLLSDPREKGNTICIEEDGTWSYSPDELAERFERLGYTCDGELPSLIRSQP